MARENHPRIRQERELARKSGRRAPYDRVLIVCEGSKTEPNYFQAIRNHYRLHWANVQVYASGYGTTPLQVVEYAHDLFLNGDPRKQIRAKVFDQVFTVFDRDEHLNYLDALHTCQALNCKIRNDERKAVGFHAVASVPCFELWLLLHFEEIKSPLHRKEALQKLKNYLPQYEKGSTSIFEMIQSQTQVAIVRATKLAQYKSMFDKSGPFTNVHELVELLTRLKSHTEV